MALGKVTFVTKDVAFADLCRETLPDIFGPEWALTAELSPFSHGPAGPDHLGFHAWGSWYPAGSRSNRASARLVFAKPKRFGRVTSNGWHDRP